MSFRVSNQTNWAGVEPAESPTVDTSHAQRGTLRKIRHQSSTFFTAPPRFPEEHYLVLASSSCGAGLQCGRTASKICLEILSLVTSTLRRHCLGAGKMAKVHNGTMAQWQRTAPCPLFCGITKVQGRRERSARTRGDGLARGAASVQGAGQHGRDGTGKAGVGLMA